MRRQLVKVVSLVLATLALPFLLFAAITTNNASSGQSGAATEASDILVMPADTLAALPVPPLVVSDNDTDNLALVNIKDSNKVKALADLRQQGLSFMATEEGLINNLSAEQAPIVLSKEVSGAANVAKQFLSDYGKYFGISDSSQLRPTETSSDDIGYTHLRYRQLYKNVPVFGGELMVHLDSNETVTSAGGQVMTGLNLAVKPGWNAVRIKAAAETIGQKQFKMTAPRAETPTLYVYNRRSWDRLSDNKNYLAYEVAIGDASTLQRKILFLNAANGQVLDIFEGVVNNINRQIYNCNGYKIGTACYTNDAPKGWGRGRLEGEPNVPDAVVNMVYDDLKTSHDYFYDKFGINGANNKGGINGGITKIFANVNTPLFAYWLGGSSQYIVVSMALRNQSRDTNAKSMYHEYTHAVFEFQGPVSVYRLENGAMDEAYADIFEVATAQAIEGTNDWETTWTDLANPHDCVDPKGNYGDCPLSHYDGNFRCGSNYEMHTNGVVVSYLAYLLSQGGDLEGCHIQSVGFDKVQKILYSALDKYLVNTPDYTDLYNAVNNACNSRYDKTTCQRVQYAMQVSEWDHPGRCDDPTGNKRDGKHCDKYGNPLSNSKELCAKYNYNCGTTEIYNDDAGGFVTVDCGKCVNPKDECINNRCAACQPKSDAEICALFAKKYECGKAGVVDNCGNSRTIDCGLNCPPDKICQKGKCVHPKGVKADGGQYDANGNPLSNGGYYRHITIGNAVLFKENFNAGEQISTPNTQAMYQKYCWQNNGGKCLQFGGLYQWHTAMNLPARCDRENCDDLINPINHRGICPEGWHVPTDGEWSQVEDTLKLPDQSCNPDRNNLYDCYPAGATMRLTGDNDFTAKIFSGIHDRQAITGAYWLSATKVGTFNPQSIYARVLKLPTYGNPNDKKAPPVTQSDQSSGVGRVLTGKNYFFALRCFADCQLRDGEWSGWKPIGACGETKPNVQKQYRTCDNRACGGQACAGDAVREISCDSDTSCGGLVKYDGGPVDKYARAQTLSGNPGGYYRSVLINDVCWLANDLNVGTMIKNGQAGNPKDNIIEKSCDDNNAANCASQGALYTWEEATKKYFNYLEVKSKSISMEDTVKQSVGAVYNQGICPKGWRLPTNEELDQLYDKESFASCFVKRLNSQLGSQAWCANFGCIDYFPTCGQSGFDAEGHGNELGYWSGQGFTRVKDVEWDSDAEKVKRGDPYFAPIYLYGYLTSTDVYTYEWDTAKNYDDIGWARYNSPHPVRCVRGCEVVDGGWSDWQPDGACGQYEANVQRYKRACDNPAPKCGGQNCDGLNFKEERCGGAVANCGLVPYEGGPYDANGQLRNNGGYYRTVLVRGTNAAGVTIDQCWLRDNLNVGAPIPSYKAITKYGQDGKIITCEPINQANDGLTEKYCNNYYVNTQDSDEFMKCTNNSGAQAFTDTCNRMGGLYQWHEAMNLSFKCADTNIVGSANIVCGVPKIHRGICPVGWHMPTDDEWHLLELYYSNTAGNLITCDANRLSVKGSLNDDQWALANCANAGYKLKDQGLSGFDAITSGLRNADGSFQVSHSYFWTTAAPREQILISDDNGVKKYRIVTDKAIDRFLLTGNWANNLNNAGVYRSNPARKTALPARCVKDSCITINSNDPNYLVARSAGQSGVGFGVYNPSGLPYCDTTINNTSVTPGASVDQGQTIPSSDGSQLSLNEQVDYLRKIVSQISSGRTYTGDQLLFINSPQVYLSEYGFTEAKRRLSGSGTAVY